MDDILTDAKEAFDQAVDAERENREVGLEDLKFSRLGDQWPEKIRKQRETDGRPCLTLNRMPSFRRQVVNDARQNKPSIKVHPVDSGSDRKTAEIINGLFRNIEYSSDADVAYDTGVECAVDCGFGFWRIDIDYAHEDTFDLDIAIRRVANPFSVYGDPSSTSADSSDWNTAFHVDRMEKDEFERHHKGAEKVDWEFDYQDIGGEWFDGEHVMVADWWVREEVDKTIALLSDGQVIDAAQLDQLQDWLFASGITVQGERQTRGFKVTRHKLTGAEVLSSEPWPGKFIPIIPVYGDEFYVEGKRYLRSLIHSAKDAQRQYNYWRTTATELVALAPRVPFIGPVGAFSTDGAKWATANIENHAFAEYDVIADAPDGGRPTRQPLDSGGAAGAMQQALTASDDMKSIIGIHDASLGARSNETSGRAIMARQREGDVATFHFIDNLTRAIRHTGRVVLDLIPHVYSDKRIVRILGEDGSEESKPVNQPVEVTDDDGNVMMEPETGPDGQPLMQQVMDQMGQPVMGPDGQPQMQPVMRARTEVYDLTAGKYDLVVSSGPSFTTRREESANQMIQMIQANPALAPIIGDLVAKNLDWPGADEIQKRLQKILPPQLAENAIPPELQKQIEEGQQRLAQLEQENAQLKSTEQREMMKLQLEAERLHLDGMKAMQELGMEREQIMQALKEMQGRLMIDGHKAETDRFKAETERVKAVGDLYAPRETFDPANPGSYAA